MWDSLQEGTAAAPKKVGPLTRTDFVRYQGASGDFNPIHHDDEFAKSIYTQSAPLVEVRRGPSCGITGSE